MNKYKVLLDEMAEKDKGILKSQPKRIDIPEELLWGLYWGNCYTMEKIAEIFNCDRGTIGRRIKGFGIPVYGGYKGKVNFSDVQQQVFEGCMLGDGSMVKSEWNKYPCFGYYDKHLKYLEFIQDVLGIKDISRMENHRRCYSVWTRHLRELNEEHGRWYPNGRGTIDDRHYKVIPYDLGLTPVSMLFWYVGDGTYNKRSGALFFTNCLNKDDAEFLREEIKRVLNVEDGITLTRHYDSYNIRLNRQATNRFFELVKEISFSIPECYQYKFRIGT